MSKKTSPIATSQRRIIIIGATSGIGREVAQIYIAQGHIVGLAARRTNILSEIQNNRKNIFTATIDICSHDAPEKLEHLIKQMGGIDLIIHSSGIGYINPQLDPASELETIDTNVKGWTAIIDWAFLYLLKQGYGPLVAITSIASLRGLAPAPAYSASKAYQAHYLEALQQRVVKTGLPVTITNIRPGFIRTPLLSNPDKFFWVIDTYKAAHAIVKALKQRRPIVTIPYRWRLMIPFINLMPNNIIAHLIARKI